MGTVTLPYTLSVGNLLDARKVMADYYALMNEVNGSLENSNIGAGAITAVKITDDTIETAKIKDANVTLAKLADDILERMFPMGSIIAIHPDAKDMPDASKWSPCDGVADLPAAYFETSNDTKVPNLTDERILLGGTAYGTGGTNDYLAHTHDYTEVGDHAVGQPMFTVASHKHQSGYLDSDGSLYLYDNATNPQTPLDYGQRGITYPEVDIYEIQNANKDLYTGTQTATTTRTTAFAVNSHSGDAIGSVVESRTDKNLPLYFKVKFYMRIA